MVGPARPGVGITLSDGERRENASRPAVTCGMVLGGSFDVQCTWMVICVYADEADVRGQRVTSASSLCLLPWPAARITSCNRAGVSVQVPSCAAASPSCREMYRSISVNSASSLAVMAATGSWLGCRLLGSVRRDHLLEGCSGVPQVRPDSGGSLAGCYGDFLRGQAVVVQRGNGPLGLGQLP